MGKPFIRRITFAVVLPAMLSFTGTAHAEQATAEMNVGATVVGSLEAWETTGERGEPVLLMSSSSDAAISADEGVEVTQGDGSWSAIATADTSEPVYITLTY